MVRIQQDMKLAEVMGKILSEEYAAVPPTDYKKQVRIQIMLKAMASESFCNELEQEIQVSLSAPTRLDEIDALIEDLPCGVEEILERHGVIKTAKEFVQLYKMKEGGTK